MRSLGPTSQTPGGGRGVLWPLGLMAALVLGACALMPAEAEVSPYREGTVVREATTLTRRPSRPQSGVRLFHGVGSDTWAAVLGTPSTAPAHPVLLSPRGRPGASPWPLVVHRWGRGERQVPSDAAMARRVRHPVVPPSSMDIADRPPLVTRPLRGPPVRG